MDIETYNKLKFIITGIKTKNDAYNCINKYKDSAYYNLIASYIEGQTYEKTCDNETMIKHIEILSEMKYKEPSYEYISNVLKHTIDIAQIKTLTRIADMKDNKPIGNDNKKNKDIQIAKKCPHCGHECITSKNTNYVICGYGINGYDWNGCGKDWCFQCGKKLCKTWEHDQLFVISNRKHNIKCCKKYANDNDLKYNENYCRCNVNHDE